MPSGYSYESDKFTRSLFLAMAAVSIIWVYGFMSYSPQLDTRMEEQKSALSVSLTRKKAIEITQPAKPAEELKTDPVKVVAAEAPRKTQAKREKPLEQIIQESIETYDATKSVVQKNSSEIFFPSPIREAFEAAKKRKSWRKSSSTSVSTHLNAHGDQIITNENGCRFRQKQLEGSTAWYWAGCSKPSEIQLRYVNHFKRVPSFDDTR